MGFAEFCDRLHGKCHDETPRKDGGGSGTVQHRTLAERVAGCGHSAVVLLTRLTEGGARVFKYIATLPEVTLDSLADWARLLGEEVSEVREERVTMWQWECEENRCIPLTKVLGGLRALEFAAGEMLKRLLRVFGERRVA